MTSGEMCSSVKILAIAGSPRRGGNTDALLEQAIAGAEGAGAVVERVVLSQLSVSPCIECNRCFETGRCAVQDDYQALYEETLAADGIILAAIFFMNTAVGQSVHRPLQCLWRCACFICRALLQGQRDERICPRRAGQTKFTARC